MRPTLLVTVPVLRTVVSTAARTGLALLAVAVLAVTGIWRTAGPLLGIIAALSAVVALWLTARLVRRAARRLLSSSLWDGPR